MGQAGTGADIELTLRNELAQGDAMIGTIAPILRHLLDNGEHSVFSDEVVARVRGMIDHLARQLLDAKSKARGEIEQPEHSQALLHALQVNLMAHRGVLAHTHALAMEWQLTERLQVRLALDPVISPLLQALISAPDGNVSATAMTLLAAQARFAQAQRRMELPLGELPGDLLHAALLGLRAITDETEEDLRLTTEAERLVRSDYDEGRSRLGLIAGLVIGMGGGASAALSVAHAGVAIFASALAMASGQDRDLAILATNERQLARLALVLRACGLKPEAVEEQFLSLHPTITLPEYFALISPDRATGILAGSDCVVGG